MLINVRIHRGWEGAGMVEGTGTRENPWQLTTPGARPPSSPFATHRSTRPRWWYEPEKKLRYHLRCLEDLHAMLKDHGDWMPLGAADEQKPTADGTVEAWARSRDNPVRGWYGLKKGLRGRFAVYVPPVMRVLGLAEVEDNPRNNRMRAV